MEMTEQELRDRTKAFAKRVLGLVEALPRTRWGNVVAGQLGRSGTSVGANDRAVCRARSTADFASKLGVMEEEADESAFWMELVIDGDMLPSDKVQPLGEEANALTAIMVSSRKTVAARVHKSKA
jgi:four helix bundle protein